MPNARSIGELHRREVSADLEVQAQIEAESHKPEQGGGCTCGFCVWSVQHVVVMSVREAVRRVGIGF